MRSPGGPRPRGRGRATEASRRIYRALLRAYPEEVREVYGEEMADCFGDMCRGEARDGGPKGLALLWARTLELLEAIRRRGSIGPAGAALETSLSVSEAEDMLSGLASGGHIEVRADGGRLRYHLWEGDG